MPARILAIALLLPLITGCTISASAGTGPLTPPPRSEATVSSMDPVEAARFHLEAVLGPEVFARTVTSVRTLNSVLVVTLAEPPTNLATVDRYWRVCRVLAAEVSVPDIEPGKTALVVIQPNGANFVYALAGESTCKLA